MIQMIKAEDIRTTPTGTGITGLKGVLYQTSNESPSRFLFWDGTRHIQLVGVDGDSNLLYPDGSIMALSEAVAVVNLTATGTAFTGACEFRGIKVTAYNGGPQTITVYDNTSAAGTLIDTIVVDGLGTWLWDRSTDASDRSQSGARRICGTGCHVVISGGTSRTIDVMVE